MTDPGYTHREELVLAITPKCTAAVALPCAIFTLYEIYCDHRSKGTNAIQRAIVGMTAIDMLSTSAWFLSSWAVPRGTFALSTGNQASCNYQGFLLQLAIGAPLYNCSLALFYLLVIKYRWVDAQLASIEKWVHAFILFFSIGTAILLLPLDQYNPSGQVCWVNGYPKGCNESSLQYGDIPCKRGFNAWIYGTVLFYGPLWICVIACTLSMAIIHREVRRTTRRLSRYSFNQSQSHSLGRSGDNASRVATQAILYSVSFIITWMPSTLWSIAQWFNWDHFALDFAAGFCEPLQALWNLLIFARTRTSTKRKVRHLLNKIMPCFCAYSEEDLSNIRDRRKSSIPRRQKSSTEVTGNISGTDSISNHAGNENSRCSYTDVPSWHDDERKSTLPSGDDDPANGSTSNMDRAESPSNPVMNDHLPAVPPPTDCEEGLSDNRVRTKSCLRDRSNPNIAGTGNLSRTSSPSNSPGRKSPLAVHFVVDDRSPQEACSLPALGGEEKGDCAVGG